MTDPRPLQIAEGWADTEFNGVPIVECVLRAFVGRCQACGGAAEEQREGSVLINPLEIDGTLYGDTLCVGCCDDEPDGFFFVLPPLDDGQGPEGEGW